MLTFKGSGGEGGSEKNNQCDRAPKCVVTEEKEGNFEEGSQQCEMF